MLDLFDRSEASSTTTAPSTSGEGMPGKKRGLEGMLSGLGELWDKEEYEREFDVDQFVRSLNT